MVNNYTTPHVSLTSSTQQSDNMDIHLDNIGIMDIPRDVLCHIMTYREKHSFLFLGLVNKAFLMYMEDNLTSYVSALGSETRLKCVIDSGELSGDGDALLNDMLLYGVARHDIPHCIPTLLKAGMQWDPFAVEEAGEWESIKFLRYVEESGLFWLPENAYASACSYGKIDFMKKMVSEGLGFPDYRCMYMSIADGNIEMVEWLTLIMNSSKYNLTLAARDNDIILFNCMVDDENAELYQRLVTEACLNGSIDIIASLGRRGIHPTESDISHAKEMGREFVTDYVIEDSSDDDDDFNLI